ncbi:MAG: DUF4331 family protein, partial [Acidobacteriota bacterium]
GATMKLTFERLAGVFLLATIAVLPTPAAAIPIDPCAEVTSTFAWLSNGAHDKLYLIMNFNPLHEPGRNQGLRVCDGYRYEFHVGKGTSLKDEAVYRIEFKSTLTPEATPSATDNLGGGNEVLWQLTGATETMTVTRLQAPGSPNPVILGENLKTLPANVGPQTDRLVYGLGAFKGYDSGDPSSREQGLYGQTFVDTFIQPLSGGGRIIAGEFDDPYQLDDKGLSDLFNLGKADVGGLAGARSTSIEDVFAGFNTYAIALELPTSDLFPNGIPHNGQSQTASTDSLLRIWSGVSRQSVQTVDPGNAITGLRGSGNYVQVSRNALPLFGSLIVGMQRRSSYLHSDPTKDVTRFGADILFPVIVRDLDAVGVYKALGVPASAVTTLKGPRLDIINFVNLGRPIPVADGSTGDVLTLDAAVDSRFPNGRVLGGGAAANKNQVNVNGTTLSLLLAGDPGAGLLKGVESNDRDFLPRFPFLAPANQGLLQGHGGTNATAQPTIPNPTQPQPCSN